MMAASEGEHETISCNRQNILEHGWILELRQFRDRLSLWDEYCKHTDLIILEHETLCRSLTTQPYQLWIIWYVYNDHILARSEASPTRRLDGPELHSNIKIDLGLYLCLPPFLCLSSCSFLGSFFSMTQVSTTCFVSTFFPSVCFASLMRRI